MPNNSIPQTEAELLYQFLRQQLEKGGRDEPIDRLLAEFAEYRRELERARALVREAIESSDRGESGPLDLDDLIRRANERLTAEGIFD